MSNISAENIKLLREKTGAGMMDCKKALVENDGNISKATSWLRKKGIAKAEKKSSRVAAQGLVGLKTCDNFSLLLEINSETDFVSKNQDFQRKPFQNDDFAPSNSKFSLLTSFAFPLF